MSKDWKLKGNGRETQTGSRDPLFPCLPPLLLADLSRGFQGKPHYHLIWYRQRPAKHGRGLLQLSRPSRFQEVTYRVTADVQPIYLNYSNTPKWVSK